VNTAGGSTGTVGQACGFDQRRCLRGCSGGSATGRDWPGSPATKRVLISQLMLVGRWPQPSRMTIVGIWIRIKVGHYLSKISHRNLQSDVAARQEFDRPGDRICRSVVTRAVPLHLLEIDPKLLHDLPDPIAVFRHARRVAPCGPALWWIRRRPLDGSTVMGSDHVPRARSRHLPSSRRVRPCGDLGHRGRSLR